jgi:hypothetical protein
LLDQLEEVKSVIGPVDFIMNLFAVVLEETYKTIGSTYPLTFGFEGS